MKALSPKERERKLEELNTQLMAAVSADRHGDAKSLLAKLKEVREAPEAPPSIELEYWPHCPDPKEKYPVAFGSGAFRFIPGHSTGQAVDTPPYGGYVYLSPKAVRELAGNATEGPLAEAIALMDSDPKIEADAAEAEVIRRMNQRERKSTKAVGKSAQSGPTYVTIEGIRFLVGQDGKKHYVGPATDPLPGLARVS